MDTFWADIATQLEAVREGADTFDKVSSILGGTDDEAFFGGSGGDDQLGYALSSAGWTVEYFEYPYWFRAEHTTTHETLTYVEGDVYRGYPEGQQQ